MEDGIGTKILTKNEAIKGLQCPLCSHESDLKWQIPRPKSWGEGRFHTAYWLCRGCDSAFMDPLDHMYGEVEKARYDLHQNSESDPSYMNYLAPVYDHMKATKPESSLRVLDYGSGPNPVLASAVRKLGFDVQIYDPFFHPVLPTEKFDRVMCTEVIEHFKFPSLDFRKIRNLLKDDGELVLMTQILEAGRDFANWHYRRDPTHVHFYSPKALEWIRDSYGFKSVRNLGPHTFVFSV